MFRFKIAILLGGIAVAYWGAQEYRVSAGTQVEPATIDLRFMEMGHEPEHNHVFIGEHVADYEGTVYEYDEDTQRVTHAYYPIVSESHPFFADLNALEKQYGDVNDAPESEWPEISTFRILVKTQRFTYEEDIPHGLNWEDKLQGMVVNLVDRMDSEERAMIQESFPSLDMDQLLIVEEGRRPTPVVMSVGIMGGGGLMSLLGCGWMFFTGGGFFE